jgi:hypothetical protein
MSFGLTNTPDEVPSNTYLTSEQYNLLLSIDPKFKDKYQIQQDMYNDQELNELMKMSDPYDMRLPENERMLDTRGLVADDEFEADVDENVSGGFPWGAVASLIGSALPGLIDMGIKHFKKGRGGMVGQQFLRDNMEQIKSADEYLKSIQHPYKFYKEFQNIMKQVMHPLLLSEGHPEDFAKLSAQKMVDRMYPNLFKQIISKVPKKEGRGRPMNNVDLAEPIVKYALKKLTGSENLSKKYWSQYKNKIRSGGEIFATGGFNWGAIFNIARQALQYLIPLITSETGKKITKEIASIGINKLLNKFIMNKDIRDKISPVAKTAISGLVDIIPKGKGGFVRPPNKKGGFVRPPQGGESKKKTLQ